MNFKNEIKYKRGDAILKEKPFAFVLKSKLHAERCDYCFISNKLLKCSGCSFVRYCNRLCQKNGWAIHKYECHNLKRVSPRIVPDAARMLGRIILQLNRNGGNEKSYYSDSKNRTFRDLMSHYNELKKDEKRLEHFMSINAVLHEYLVDQIIPNISELLVIYGKMVVNTFNILDSEMQTIGTGLYLGASIIDHSCSPNAIAVFEGTNIIIRTLEDLSVLDWTKVYISYIEMLNLPAIRKNELQTLYYFLCECERCSDVNELGCMTATLCQNKKCSDCILKGIIDATVCSSCNEIITQETKNIIKDVLEFTQNNLEKMRDVAYLDICQMCLVKQEGLFHPMNIYKVKILDLAMESCIELQNWEKALHYGKQLLEPFRKYYGEINPIRGIFLVKLGKILLLLNEYREAKKYFSEAASILSITHGKMHSLVKNDIREYIQQCISEK